MSTGIKVNWKSIEFNENTGTYTVYGHGIWGSSSILAGMAGRKMIDIYRTIEEAKAEHPDAEVSGHTKFFYSNDPGPVAPDWFDPLAAGESWDEE